MDYRNDHLLKILDAQPREDTLAIAAATEIRRLLGKSNGTAYAEGGSDMGRKSRGE